MRFHNRIVIVDLAAALPEITDQFFAALELRARRLVAIEIADQTNSERDVVQIIAVDVATIDLPPPTVAHLVLAVAGGSSVTDHKMISESVLHPSKMTVVIIERGRVSLTRPAVVHDDKLPAAARDWCAIDLRFYRRREITIARTAAAAAAAAAAKQACPKTARLFVAVFLDR